jgi:hypothetical protein
MSVAATLAEAAGLTYDNLFVPWQLGLIFRNKLLIFASDVNTFFPDEPQNNRPIGNWTIPLLSFVTPLTAADNRNLEVLNKAVDFVYRICWAGQFAFNAGLITSGQADDLLDSYNSLFG